MGLSFLRIYSTAALHHDATAETRHSVVNTGTAGAVALAAQVCDDGAGLLAFRPRPLMTPDAARTRAKLPRTRR